MAMTLATETMEQGDRDREHDTTLLAKALYDNLADAPDELSFRKGDIVTVIERDVDGLVGWWLCILHGRQGIAPGNRLQVLSEGENGAVRRAARRGSYSTDDFSDSQDGSWLSDASPHQQLDYDTLPAPVKAGHSIPENRSNRLSVKDLYDIPLGHGGDTLRRGLSLFQSYGLETYDLPTTLPRGSRSTKPQFQEVYDVPGNNPDELYDRPPLLTDPASPRYSKPKPVHETHDVFFSEGQGGRTGPSDPAEVYDIPSASSKPVQDGQRAPEDTDDMVYDVPHHIGTPHRGRSYNISSASPPGTPKSPRAADVCVVPAPNATGTTNYNPLSNYDVPRKLHQYDVPRKHPNPQEIYDIPPNQTGPAEVYDVPARFGGNTHVPSNVSFNQSSMQGFKEEPCDLYDIPVNVDLRGTVQGQKVNNEHNNNLQSSQENQPTPRVLSGIVPNKVAEMMERFNSRNLSINNNNEENYDAPNSLKQKESGGMDLEATQEIYDVPSRKASDVDEMYDVPSRKTSGLDEMYDIPPSSTLHEAPTEIYDTPSKQVKKKPVPVPLKGAMPEKAPAEPSQEMYDVPPAHDVNKVMADIGIRDPRRNRSIRRIDNLRTDSDEDDYVDYEDIYGREPPSYLMKEMEKGTPPSSSTTAKPPGPRRQQSVLEQINMDAVKELTITSAQALDRLAKLHLAVDTAVTTLLGFAAGDWLDPANLKTSISAIRGMAGKVKIALRLLTEFGLGAVVNAKQVNCSDDVLKKINGNVEPLVESYYKIKVCLLHLDSNDWTVPAVRNPDSEKFFATVNAIMILSERIPENCRQMNSVIQANLATLFGKYDDEVTPPVVKEQEQKPSPVAQSGVRHDLKGKLKQIGPIDPKTVRGILDIDERMNTQASTNVFEPRRSTVSGDANSGTLRRRQQVATTTLPRPPVPPKPALPNNRRSLAIVAPDTLWLKSPVSSRVETLVTEYAVDSPRIKYNSDPTRSPSEIEKNKDPAWGGSCPSLQGENSTVTERGLINTSRSDEVMPKSASQDDVDSRTSQRLNSVSLGRKLPSESNIHDPEVQVNPTLHSRSASVPYDEKDAKFPSYESEATRSQVRSPTTKVAKLDHRDIETLEFFLRQVEAQVMILRGAMKSLTESVEKNSIPQVFVAHSKFVILTAHKVVHAAEEVTERLIDQGVTHRIRRENVHLTDSIRAVVAATKTAALEYPKSSTMVDMISTVVSLGESVRDIHGEAKRALNM